MVGLAVTADLNGNVSAGSQVISLYSQMCPASGRNIYVYSEMPTEVVCAL